MVARRKTSWKRPSPPVWIVAEIPDLAITVGALVGINQTATGAEMRGYGS